MSGLTDQPADLLTVILDLNPLAWEEVESIEGVTLASVLEAFLIFANAHRALRHENAIAVYGATLGSSELLYSSAQTKSSTLTASQFSVSRDPSAYQTFRVLNDSITEGAMRLARSAESNAFIGRHVGIVKALAKALCHINRITKENDDKKNPLKSRILILSVSGDAPGQYIPMMNCIFSAQKANIPIDVCKIAGDNAVFMQQAAHLCEGIYYRIEKPQALIQYLTVIFLPGMYARKLLNLPQQNEVDLRAACFCHRKIIDIGYVCSVCLSIFCSPIPVCSTCRTKFPMSTLKRFIVPKSKARMKSANGSALASS
ncbi:hypothetical protein O181_081493 [Austropuccinia psidii MF-1]|uniref:General transcription and DNA repair factor IIH subunit TFB4 n=1 Tax=Austropuccinia psidii MF-1 TaxID=1389203 RepID=A0A9Q3IHJ1_9BASI|nr:hypothetical protein [Austropuccinia psidii MF-1]